MEAGTPASKAPVTAGLIDTFKAEGSGRDGVPRRGDDCESARGIEGSGSALAMSR
jgi:hypothetical protein